MPFSIFSRFRYFRVVVPYLPALVSSRLCGFPVLFRRPSPNYSPRRGRYCTISAFFPPGRILDTTITTTYLLR
ncbi:hypothetical protein GGS20DRAFT_567766 [Poronia punctata]|nr:hypothetical protein GGS20DRAFT_567766 [Poronia punctata]